MCLLHDGGGVPCQTIFICDLSEQNMHFMTNYDVFLTLTKLLFVPKPDQSMNTALCQERNKKIQPKMLQRRR